MGSHAPVSNLDAPHIVVVPRSTPGHTIPFLQFARRLARAGVVTTVVTSDKLYQELATSLDATDFTSQIEGYPLRIVALQDKTSLALPHRAWAEQVQQDRSVELRVIGLLESLISDLSSPASLSLRGVAPATPPAWILHDMFESWAQEAAENLQIEKHLLYVSSAAALSCALQSRRLYEAGLVPVRRETRERVFDEIPGLLPMSAVNLPLGFLDGPLYEWMRRRHDSFRNADVILVNTFYDLEKPVLDALRDCVIGTASVRARCVLDIGPLLSESFGNNENEKEDRDPCLCWLDEREANSVLYVSFGSFATNSRAQLLELALGLEASTVSFLWNIRPLGTQGFSSASETVSVTEFLPVGFEDRVRGRGLCYSHWAPQTRILEHPAVGGFLSHCGWNSTLETVCAGVPILAWPKQAEQHLNRRFLVDSVKVAIELLGNPYTKEELESEVVRPTLFVSKEEIETKARSLLLEAEGAIVRENVQRLRARARQVGASGGSSRRNFEAYVRLLHHGTPRV